MLDFQHTTTERVRVCFSVTEGTGYKDLLMPEMKRTLATSFSNVVYVLKKAAVSLFGYGVSHKSMALSDSKARTVSYLLSKLENWFIKTVAPAHIFPERSKPI